MEVRTATAVVETDGNTAEPCYLERHCTLPVRLAIQYNPPYFLVDIGLMKQVEV